MRTSASRTLIFRQLTVVAPRMARGDRARLEPFVFVPCCTGIVADAGEVRRRDEVSA